MGEERKIDLSQFREKFAQEAKARIARMNGGLVYLGKNPGEGKLEGDILREAHNVKGAAKLPMRFEGALARRKDKTILANQDLTDALFVTLDTLTRLVDALSQPPRELIDVGAVLDRLRLSQVVMGGPGLPPPPPLPLPGGGFHVVGGPAPG